MAASTHKQSSFDAIRTLTVSSLRREWGAAYCRNESIVPSIRLNGKWLTALGLVPGQKVCVLTNGVTITISPLGFDGKG